MAVPNWNTVLTWNSKTEGIKIKRRLSPALHLGGLSDDLIHEILLRLPAYSLGKFKLVCREWRRLISSPSFCDAHWKQPKRSNSVMFDAYHIGHPSTTGLYDVIGSCNGILCYLQRDLTLLLFNPINRQSTQFPPLPIDAAAAADADAAAQVEPITITNYGFGHDPVSNDYVAVAITSPQDQDQDQDQSPSQVHVCTLRTGSWERLQDTTHCLDDNEGLFLNGAFHWLSRRFHDYQGWSSVVAFDLACRTFRDKIIPQPPTYNQRRHTLARLAKINGHVCFCCYFENGIEVSRMVHHSHDDSYSWALMFVVGGNGVPSTVPESFQSCVPISYFSSQSIVRLHERYKKRRRLILYDLINKTYTYENDGLKYRLPIQCEFSLVPLNK